MGPRLYLIGTNLYLAGTDLYLVGTNLYLIGTDLYEKSDLVTICRGDEKSDLVTKNKCRGDDKSSDGKSW